MGREGRGQRRKEGEGEKRLMHGEGGGVIQTERHTDRQRDRQSQRERQTEGGRWGRGGGGMGCWTDLARIKAKGFREDLP